MKNSTTTILSVLVILPSQRQELIIRNQIGKQLSQVKCYLFIYLGKDNWNPLEINKQNYRLNESSKISHTQAEIEKVLSLCIKKKRTALNAQFSLAQGH